MKNKINVWINEPSRKGDEITYSAKVELPSGQWDELWYRVPHEYENDVTTISDPYLQATLFWSMGHGHNLHIHGDVSLSLLQNIEDFKHHWVCWRPQNYKPIDISVNKEVDNKPPSTEQGICAFSGGVDSCFTAYRHREGIKHRRNVTAGLIIHGFEVPLKDQKAFEVSYIRAKKILNSIGMEVIPIASNSHEFSHRWMYEFMGALSSCMSLFGNRFSEGLVGGAVVKTVASGMIFPWGSNSSSDHLLSSDQFKVINDGGFYTRTQKIDYLSDWKECNENLQICWDNKKDIGNCGLCSKCLINILNYRATKNEVPSCFPHHVTPEKILNVELKYINDIEDFIEVLDEAYKNKLQNEDWVKAILDLLATEKALELQGDWKQNLHQRLNMEFEHNNTFIPS